VPSDVRRALRTLAHSPGFAFAAIATLAIGIGANTAVFSIVRSVLWRPLPYAAPERLVRIGHVRSSSSRPADTFSPQDFDDLERGRPGYASVAGWHFVPGLTGMNLTGSGEPARLSAAYVSRSYFSTLGALPRLGRTIRPDENVPGRDAVVVLSERLWKSRFGGDRALVGRMIRLDGQPFLVAGVMRDDFAFPSAAVDVWAPVSLIGENEIPHMRGLRWMDAIGRLAPGVSPAAARAATSALFRRLETQYPDSNEGFGVAAVEPLADALLGDVRRPLLILLGAVGLVLGILCANLAGLLIARGGARRREIAIRLALGASRGRIVRHLLLETAILAFAGGVGGAVVASWSVTVASSTLASLPRAAGIELDAGALAFAFAITCVTGLAFGLLPALQAAAPNVARTLEAGGRSGGIDPLRRRVLRGIVVGECLLAGVLLAGAGLLAKSFWKLTTVESGAETEHVLALSMTIPDDRYPTREKKKIYRREIIDRLRALPGVTAAGSSKTMPFSGGGEPYSFSDATRPEKDAQWKPEAGTFIVTPGYFAALGVPLLTGRDFSQDDIDQDRQVLVVNEAFARRAWPGAAAVGRWLQAGPSLRFEVIGVARDVRHEGLDRPARSAVYVPGSIFQRSTFKVFLRFAGDPGSLAGAARSAVWSVDRDQPISDIATLPEVMARSVARPRFFMLLLVAFGAAALSLAALGLYGTLSYGVRQRRREIGIRMALGADARHVLRLVLGEGAALAGLGVALAIPAALVLSRLLSGLLFEVKPADPVVLALVGAFLLGVAGLASAFPAWRAARVDPSIALRQD
jgi:putative ABC transport system permease protein